MNYHLIGNQGSSMQGIARMLVLAGHTVTGTDAKTTGHGPNLLPATLDAVIYTASVRPGTPGWAELEAARARSGVTVYSRIEFIAHWTRDQRTVAVAGAHGKSTTTALIAWGLRQAGRDPTFFMGAPLVGSDESTHAGSGEVAVIEACEWNRQFLALHPSILIVLSIDREHLDTFPGGIPEIQATLRELMTQMSPGGLVVLNTDDSNVRTLSDDVPPRLRRLSFGREPSNDYQLGPIERTNTGLGVGIRESTGTAQLLSAPLVGQHHATNCAAAAVVLRELGLSWAEVSAGLASFPGLRRRFERWLDTPALTIIDDYAHHPREVAATIAAARSRYPDRRLVAILQPHTSQRSLDLYHEFVAALGQADLVVLAETVEPAGRTVPSGSADAADLGRGLEELGRRVERAGPITGIPALLDQVVEPQDVLLFMGATEIWTVARQLAERHGGTA